MATYSKACPSQSNVDNIPNDRYVIYPGSWADQMDPADTGHKETTLQLDLFTDNRRTILLNDAAGLLRLLELEKASAIYADLLMDEPDDEALLHVKFEAEKWGELLSGLLDADAHQLNAIYLLLPEVTSLRLREGILTFLIDRLLAFPSPELVYIPPHFHLGCLFREMGRHVEAGYWFVAALRSGRAERGRFLAWHGDVVTLCGDDAAAMEHYQAAFLEDPGTVEIDSLANRTIRNLLHSPDHDNFDEEPDDRETDAWLPFVGWLNGTFSLDLNVITLDRGDFVNYLQLADDEAKLLPARLWYEYLRYAEYLRTCLRDDPELVRVRRRMKELNAYMFARYMKKIGRG